MYGLIYDLSVTYSTSKHRIHQAQLSQQRHLQLLTKDCIYSNMESGSLSHLYPQMFSWPPDDAFVPGSKTRPEDIGVELIEQDVQTELISMVKAAKENEQDEPFCLFDLGSVVKQFLLWKKACPLVQPFYAMKTYNDPVVVKLLAELGAGVDCASKGEIQMVRKLGVKPNNIVFTSTNKLPSHLRYAAVAGVSQMTFDSHDELHKIKQYYPEARLLLRLCPQTNEQVQISFRDQFGCKIHEVEGLLQTAKQLGLSVVGVSFHVGSGCTDPAIYIREINAARKVFDIAEQEGFHMTILDIGGGFSGKSGSEQLNFKIFSAINSHVAEYFPGVKVIAEPGRYFIESALTVATTVISEKKRGPDAQTECGFVISSSAFGTLNYSIFFRGFRNTRYQPKLVLREPSSKKTYDYVLRGPTSAPSDFINCINVPELQLGDWLLFENVGAYSACVATSFNGFQPPPIHRVMNRITWESLFMSNMPDPEAVNGVECLQPFLQKAKI